MPAGRWPSASGTATAYLIALVISAVTSVFLLRIPVQFSDSFTEFQAAQQTTLAGVLQREFQGGPYFRPFRRGLIKVVFDASGGEYQLAFRGFQALQLVVLALLVVRSLRVRTKADAAFVPMALALVLGGHTFAGAILEGLPINHFLTIVICCAAALTLAQAKASWLVDVSAVALMVFSMLTIESGLVVAVVFLAAYLVGYRGVSRAALLGVVMCVVVYAVGRFTWLGGSTPGLQERSAGFGFRVLDPEELVVRFGTNPWPFYAYNVVSAIACVLFAEPRGGVWAFVRGVGDGSVELWRLVTVVSSTAVTLLLLAFAAQRLRRWVRFDFAREADKLVAVFLAVLLANAVFAYAYEKDAILGPAGLFFALAGTAVLREVVGGADGWRLPRPLAASLLALAVCGWSIRLVGVHYGLQVRELSTRNEWAISADWRGDRPVEPVPSVDEPIRRALWRAGITGAAEFRRLSTSRFDSWFDFGQ